MGANRTLRRLLLTKGPFGKRCSVFLSLKEGLFSSGTMIVNTVVGTFSITFKKVGVKNKDNKVAIESNRGGYYVRVDKYPKS